MTSDPVLVYVMVSILVGVVVLGLLFASPWVARMPSLPIDDAPAAGRADVDDEMPAEAAGEPADAPAAAPWSTGRAEARPPWEMPRRD